MPPARKGDRNAAFAALGEVTGGQEPILTAGPRSLHVREAMGGSVESISEYPAPR